MSSTSTFAGINFGYDSDAIFKYRNENMCHKWRQCVDDKFLFCDIKGMVNENGNYVFNGNVKDHLKSLENFQPIFIQYWAPNKPTRGYSFNGSGLPYPNEEIAYSNTSNKGVAKILEGQFTFKLDFPNSYYSQMGKKLNPPLVKFKFCDGEGNNMSKIYTVIIGDPIPFRSLNPTKKRNWSKGPLFYYNPDMSLCRNQYQILKDSSYPYNTMKEPKNFWGKKPPK
jgi:hypothetical protein